MHSFCDTHEIGSAAAGCAPHYERCRRYGMAKTNVEKSVWNFGAQALIEGMLPIPAELEEPASVLEAAGLAEAQEVRAAENSVTVTGLARFCVLYMDKRGNPESFDAECTFSHTVDAPGVLPGMQTQADVRMGEIFCRPEGASAGVKAELLLDVRAFGEQELALLDPSDCASAETLTQTVELPLPGNAKTAKAYVQAELRVPQNMPPVKRMLLARGYAALQSVAQEDDKLIVEGEMHVYVVYLSADKNAPLQHFSQVFPFGEILNQAACAEGAHTIACARLCKLFVEHSAEDEDVLEVSGVVAITSYCRTARPVPLVLDLFSLERDAALERASITCCVPRRQEGQKRVVRTGITIPESAPEAARILYTCVYPEVVEVRGERERIYLEGVLHCNLCYTTADAGVKSIRLQAPFETDFIPTDPEGAVFVDLNAEYATADGAGRELELKCCLDIQSVRMDCQTHSAVSSVTFSEQALPTESGIVVYYTDGNETLWDVAKKLRAHPDALQTQSGGTQPGRGERVFAIKG